MKRRCIRDSIIIVIMMGSLMFAHHAKEYMILEAYTTPKKGQFYYFTSFNFYKEKKGTDEFNHYEITPILTYGITDRLMGNFHFHISQFNPNAENALLKPKIFLEAYTVGLQYRLTESGEKFFDFAYSIDFEYPSSDSRKWIDGEDLLTNTLIISKELPNDMNITFNLSYEQEIFLGGEGSLGWGAGFKIPPSSKISFMEVGMEVTGKFKKSPEIHIVPGIYINPKENMIIKIGPGFGITSDATRFSFNFVFGFSF